MFNAIDLANRFKVTPRTIRAWARSGILPPPLRVSPQCVRWTEESIRDKERQLAERAASAQPEGRPA